MKRVLVRAIGVRPLRFAVEFALDAVAWAVALVLAQILRSEFAWSIAPKRYTVLLIAAAAIIQLAAGLALRLYQGRYSYGSFEELKAVAFAGLVVLVALGTPVAILGTALKTPRSVVFIAWPIAAMLMAGFRYLGRMFREYAMRSQETEPVLVFGAGYLGRRLIQAIETDHESPYRAVGVLDDDPHKRHYRIRQVDVLGCLDDLPAVIERTGARTLIVAVGAADAELMRRVTDLASPLAVQVKVMPTILQILSGDRQVSDLRDLSIEDILGRRPVDTDVASIAGYLTGKRVLVTGAGGSIGSELCRQIHKYDPAELIMLDRDETALQDVEVSIYGHGLLDGPEVVLADIRDEYNLIRLFRERRPEVVFHAAALKHLPMLQQYPEEAWKTNVLGTQNVLLAARAAGVATFVNISTDKAANPTSVLGHSKRLAERLTAGMAHQTGTRYLSVRFGNVLGSRGSMLPLFTSLIEAGGPVTVTHPDVTRYFMTIPEACQLVMQAGAIGHSGEVMILDMGDPVRILDIARRMIAMSGREIEIVYTGLRPGEKLHEVLLGETEAGARRVHPKISHAKVPAIDASALDWNHWRSEWSRPADDPAPAPTTNLADTSVD